MAQFDQNWKKTIEGRLCKGDWEKVKVGDIIVFFDNKHECKTKVKNIYKCNSFATLISDFKEQLLPTIDLSDLRNGINVYRQFYSESNEEKYGVLGVEIQILIDKE